MIKPRRTTEQQRRAVQDAARDIINRSSERAGASTEPASPEADAWPLRGWPGKVRCCLCGQALTPQTITLHPHTCRPRLLAYLAYSRPRLMAFIVCNLAISATVGFRALLVYLF